MRGGTTTCREAGRKRRKREKRQAARYLLELPPELLQRLYRAANEDGMSAAAYLRALIEEATNRFSI